MKPQTAWAIYDEDGEVLLHTIGTRRTYCITYFVNRVEPQKTKAWRLRKRLGYTCRKIKITEVE